MLMHLGPHDRLIHVYLFIKEIVQKQMNFGELFFLVIHEGETLQEIKVRIQGKLLVPDEEFAKVYIPWECIMFSLTKVYFLCFNRNGSLRSFLLVVHSTSRTLTLFLVVFSLCRSNASVICSHEGD
ncbi:hypothetical protein WN943_027312 [Citrus x changshan-huyou]